MILGLRTRDYIIDLSTFKPAEDLDNIFVFKIEDILQDDNIKDMFENTLQNYIISEQTLDENYVYKVLHQDIGVTEEDLKRACEFKNNRVARNNSKNILERIFEIHLESKLIDNIFSTPFAAYEVEGDLIYLGESRCIWHGLPCEMKLIDRYKEKFVLRLRDLTNLSGYATIFLDLADIPAVKTVYTKADFENYLQLWEELKDQLEIYQNKMNYLEDEKCMSFEEFEVEYNFYKIALENVKQKKREILKFTI